MNRTMLLVVTSHATLGGSGQGTGAWLEELAQAYFVFADAGVAVDIASPRGGAAPLDPASCAAPWLSATGERLLADPAAMATLAASRQLATVQAGRYAGMYLVGGAGAVWDLPGSQALGGLLRELSERDGTVAAVCHGAAGLVSAHDANGTPLVRGRRVTAFSNVEEEQVGYTALLPVMPEDLLRSQGARYSCAPPWQEHVVTDGWLLTGQNPASAAPLARAALARLSGAGPSGHGMSGKS